MQRKRWRGWALVVSAAAWVAFSGGRAMACYSGLVVIPTVDTVGARQFSIELQNDGRVPSVTADATLINTEIGLGERLEVGADFDLSHEAPTRVLFNAKYLAVKAPGGKRSAAVGIFNLGRHVEAAPYVVGAQSLGALRMHAGSMALQGRWRPFLGLDWPVTQRLTLMGDYTSGKENVSSVGLQCQVRDGVAVLSGIQFPNASGAARFTVHLVIGGSFGK